MPWETGRPQDTWGTRENAKFAREVYSKIRSGSFTWDPPSVGAGASVDTTITEANDQALEVLVEGMAITVTPPKTITAGLHVTGAWVPTQGQLTIRLYNSTGAPINEGSATWAFRGDVI